MNALIYIGITAQDKQGPQERLRGLLCFMARASRPQSFLSDACVSISKGSPAPESQQLPQAELFQCYNTPTIRKTLQVSNLNLHANTNQLLLALSITGTVNYFI